MDFAHLGYIKDGSLILSVCPPARFNDIRGVDLADVIETQWCPRDYWAAIFGSLGGREASAAACVT